MGMYVSRKLQTWLNKHGYEDITIVEDNDWYYDHGKTVISYSLVPDGKVEKTFINFCRECGLITEVSPFLLSFFHELGHYETIDIVTDEEYENAFFCKTALNMKEHHTEQDYYAYYNLEMELLATKWAVSYMNEHQEAIHNLDKEITILFAFETLPSGYIRAFDKET